LSPSGFLPLTAALGANDPDCVLLLDTPPAQATNRAFLSAFHPAKVIPVGSFPDGIDDLESRFEVKTAPSLLGPAGDARSTLVLGAHTVVVCPPEPRGRLLQAACLAGVIHAPLLINYMSADDPGGPRRLLASWKPRCIFAVGEAADVCRQVSKVPVVSLPDEKAVADRHVQELARAGSVQTLVVANPADTADGLGSMSTLAPWVALQHHAALLLTNATGDNAEAVIRAALEQPELRCADALILVAGLKAIPMLQRPNPIPGDKDPFIEMEPMTPSAGEPFTLATGRLFHEDPAVVLAVLARQRLLATAQGPRRAFVASDPGNSLPLLEAFSRNTARELHNAGYETASLFGKDVNKYELRRALIDSDLFLWEGHHNTLIKDYGLPQWDDSLPPSLVFLQSCLVLTESKTHPLLQHGAVAVVGSTSRVYSASGGACSLAFFNALLYDDQSIGGSLRQAKNFLLAYTQLKEKRLGDQAKRGGASLRSAWSFTLWGDPTLHLPKPEAPADALAPVRHRVQGDEIKVNLPDTSHDSVYTQKYQARMPPNGRLAGLVHGDKDDDCRPLVPFVFAEVRLPNAPMGKVPHLQSRLPASHYVFCWDERRSTGYLLIEPWTTSAQELRFQVRWD